MRFRVDGELRSLVTPLGIDELAILEESLRREGCRDALVVWHNAGGDVLLDGHNRREICQRLGLPFDVKRIELPDREHARLWIEENQLGRRNFPDDVRAMIAAQVYARRAKLARSEHSRGAAKSRWRGTRCPEDNASTGHRSTSSRCRPALAKETRIPERKLRQAIEVSRRAPRLAEQVRKGLLSLGAAMREIRREEIREKLESVEMRKAKELAGKYDVIVIDPPWPMEKIELDVRPNQVEYDYPRMDVEAIGNLLTEKFEKHATSDCHVFLWTTHKHLPDALEILEKIGLRYVCTFVWHKPGGVQPIGLPKYNCEFALYARKGSPKFIDARQFNVCFEAPRGKHSEKPEEFYALLRRVTAGRRLDMFSRRTISGFEGWGTEYEGETTMLEETG